MEKYVIHVDDSQKELCEHGTAAFPMTVHHDRLWTFEGNCIRCHWHNDLEIVLVRQGSIRYQVQDQSLLLSPGQGLIINADAPHSAFPLCNQQVILLTILVRPVFLYDTPGSALEQSCLRPFLSNRNLPCILLEPQESWMAGIIRRLEATDEYFTQKPFCFQLKIKSLLCDCFYEILSHFEDRLSSYSPSSQEELRRLKLLLDYLHTNYDRSISLEELAQNIHLTREGCCRFFRRMTGKTISQYLAQYRVSRSLPLLADGQYSVTQVSELCGFSSPSRFARAFHTEMGMNPREFLVQNLINHRQ